MDSKFIIAICIIGLYGLILLIVGILAYMYSIKHKPYKKVNDEYLKEIAEYKKNEAEVLKSLKPIKTKFKLSEDENVYFIDELNVSYNEFEIKKNKKKEFDDEYDQYIKNLKKNYSLFKFKPKQNDLEKSLIYISNKRIVLDDGKEFKIIKLENILLTEYFILNFGGEYLKATYLKTKNEEIYFVTDDLKLNSIITSFRMEND
ncbi:hypothetical protein MENTO_v1c03720 [Mesoplasma entomophilum]|uniref:Uncharacterized protein n=1 Tax=Mesoplasma entomophilum TaxID=2149 RepID=A0A3S5XZ22_9MOLU|nr:hypothetical protein [Mesoplasma entomophilum]ATQ35518.1 hypothetical protein CS528_01915 [Mesoplasma entomophilum]ATZ19478.1 hypothetical protein MENTO_v1c03720 [Mesoplasma entomophilum]